MSLELLVPLGLLGLLSILALIIIYIIRPNYQVRYIPSTYVWILSLKYRRKRIPTSRIRNILIFLCQLLAFAAIACILAMPAIVHYNKTNKTDVIAIIDSSASMYTQSEGETRFERAVQDVISLARDTYLKNGYVSVIVADDEPYYLAREIPHQNSALVYDALNDLLSDPTACYYGTADIEGAITLCEEVLLDNPSAEIQLFTDTTYLYVPEGVTVVNVSESDEWNAGILTATATVEDIYQTLTVQVASFGRSIDLVVEVEVYGANASDSSQVGTRISLSRQVSCNADVVYTVVFKYFSSTEGEGDAENTIYYPLGITERFQSFQSIHVDIVTAGGRIEDSLNADNSFDIYGGQKEVLRVQYASSRKLPGGTFDKENPGLNRFVNGALGMVKNAMRDRWDILITEVSPGKQPALEGFDLYIFEHDMPDELPTDGVIFLLDPTAGWAGAGVEVIEVQDMNRLSVYLSENIEQAAHPVLNNPNGYKVVADYITVSRYKVLHLDREGEYDILMTCDTDPVLLTKKNGKEQVAIMSFSVHYSNLPKLLEMPYLFYNLFDYYFPGSVNKNAFEVGEEIVVNSRGPEISVSGDNGFDETYSEFPVQFPMDLPGTYFVKQTTYYGKTSDTEIFVKIPAYESNIRRTEDTLSAPHRNKQLDRTFDDLLIYLAAALFFLLFVEWVLQAQEGR